jgi:glycosyltransferase involved in cell wall biosynthesis
VGHKPREQDRGPVRVLFLHAALEYNPEYTVHRVLAEHADPALVLSYFVWQTKTSNPHDDRPAVGPAILGTTFWDFGRDQTIRPRPSRARRAVMMARRLPPSLVMLVRLIRQIQPDVIYTCQQRHDVLLTALVRRVCRVPHLIHLHYLVQPTLGGHAVRTLKRTKHVLTVSEFLRRQAASAGLDPNRMTVLLNPADLDRFSVRSEPQQVRDLFGLPPHASLVVAAGRLDPSKGHLLLLEAFDIVRRVVPGAYLLICGETRSRNAYDAKVIRRCAELGLSEHVIFAGQRKDLPAIYAAADLFCLPTEDDPCPLVYLEAMAAGLPTVGIHSGGVPEIVGETGLLASPGNAAELAANIVRLLQDPELAAALGRAARERIISGYTPELVASRWAGILHDFYPSGSGTRKHSPARN